MAQKKVKIPFFNPIFNYVCTTQNIFMNVGKVGKNTYIERDAISLCVCVCVCVCVCGQGSVVWIYKSGHLLICYTKWQRYFSLRDWKKSGNVTCHDDFSEWLIPDDGNKKLLRNIWSANPNWRSWSRDSILSQVTKWMRKETIVLCPHLFSLCSKKKNTCS